MPILRLCVSAFAREIMMYTIFTHANLLINISDHLDSDGLEHSCYLETTRIQPNNTHCLTKTFLRSILRFFVFTAY